MNSAVWTLESTGGGCQWLRNGRLAITDGEAGAPEKNKPCVLVTLDENGDCDQLIPPIDFGSPEAAMAAVKAWERIFS